MRCALEDVRPYTGNAFCAAKSNGAPFGKAVDVLWIEDAMGGGITKCPFRHDGGSPECGDEARRLDDDGHLVGFVV